MHFQWIGDQQTIQQNQEIRKQNIANCNQRFDKVREVLLLTQFSSLLAAMHLGYPEGTTVEMFGKDAILHC